VKVGVVIPSGPDDGAGGTFDWPHVRRVAETAEAAGFDSIWVYDHLLFRFADEPTQGIHEAWTILTALAVATQRVELGAIVFAMPFRNPALLAKMATTLDEVSGGRLILGVGCGWHEPEFDAFGFPFDHRVGRFEEALRVMVPLLRDGRVQFQGRWHAADAEIIPRYRRADGSPIPILIAGKRPRMRQLVAEYADAWNTAWLGPVDELAPRLAPMLETLDEAGRDPASLEITVGVTVAAPGMPHASPDAGSGSALRGEPEEIAAAIRAYAAAGVGHLICALDPGTPEMVEQLGRALALAR
jgi:probable F420-dependent oxidoreductase